MAIASFCETYILPLVQWVPFFMLARLLFYIWLQLPVCNGSIFLFKKLVVPFFKENKSVMEAVTIENADDATSTLTEVITHLDKVFNEIKDSLN